jgi:hypothetical protein
MPALDNGLPGHPARNIIQNVAYEDARTAKRGPTVTHRGIGDNQPPKDFAHRGSPLSLGALSP